MTIESVWAQLEQDLEWRQSEIRFLANSQSNLKREDERGRALRSQLVMLYAHVEGFAKTALLLYVRAVNDFRLRRVDATDELVAASFDALFHAVQYGDPKYKVFTSTLPDDEKLHTAARKRDFVRELESLLGEVLVIPDSAVNTESNLASSVLRRNFFRLGFPPELLADYEKDINELAKRRHQIAHGADDGIVKPADYLRLQKAVYSALDTLVLNIVEALEVGRFQKPSPNYNNVRTLTVGEMR